MLPVNLRDRWIGHAVQYCDRHGVYFPPFNEFVNFVRIQSKVRNNPCFAFDTVTNTVPPSAPETIRRSAQAREQIFIRKTDFGQPSVIAQKDARCPIHNTRHQLADCNAFLQKSVPQRREILKKTDYASDVLNMDTRLDCKEEVVCESCGKNNHHTTLHNDIIDQQQVTTG